MICLFVILVIDLFGFESRMLVLNERASVHCLPITFEPKQKLTCNSNDSGCLVSLK